MEKGIKSKAQVKRPGEEVQITRRNKPVARIVPAEAQATRIALPAFAARARQIWGEPPVGKSLSQTVVDDPRESVRGKNIRTTRTATEHRLARCPQMKPERPCEAVQFGVME